MNPLLSLYFTWQTFHRLGRRKNTLPRYDYRQCGQEYAERKFEKLNANVPDWTIFDRKSKNTSITTDLKEIEQVSNYESYNFGSGQFNYLKRSEKNDIYYYAADGKRYIFPTIEVYKSWFQNIQPEDIMVYDLNKLYETPLGGNVTFRPGTLMQTPTDPHIYIVIKNGLIKPFDNENLLTLIYGENWKSLVNQIPNYFFTQYKVGTVIKSLADFPNIPKEININQDKGFK
jgi:hypothetical protein